MEYLESAMQPGEMLPGISHLLRLNAAKFAGKTVFSEKHNGVYRGITWAELYNRVLNISCNLRERGFREGDKFVIFSPNRLEMLELELAIMSSGGVAVPIFAYFHKETAELLINHCDAKFLAAGGDLQLGRIKDIDVNEIFVFDEDAGNHFQNQTRFSELYSERADRSYELPLRDDTERICLNMFTSGTMGIPKCVQITHGNILSQQAGLSRFNRVSHEDRFLSYLPWHHSFGGIFELFTALYNGAEMSLESGYGKDPATIFENWKLIRPTLFFSVPKVYQALYDLARTSDEAEQLFFHSELKFVFTAAASLPQKLSDEFERRNIPVLEGWGLTETSPCCTLTDPEKKRRAGVVGFPLPGVTLRIADDGEIQVKGPNVMKGYYKNDDANKSVFTDDGWFCTGDVGEITEDGLKLITRKDRIFKLSNGEKVIPSELEKLIEMKCHYISFAMVVGNGEEYPVALLFPNRKLLEQPHYSLSPEEGCFCPRDLEELGRCLHGCLHDANCGIKQNFAKIQAAMIIDDELSVDNGTLTSSMKLAPKNVVNAYRAHLDKLYGADNPLDNEVYIINLNKFEHKFEKKFSL